MAIIASHELMGGYVKALQGAMADAEPDVAEDLEWVVDEAAQIRADLLDRLAYEMVAADPKFSKLPRIIREGVDTWGKKPATGLYLSPIAHLIHSYLAHDEATGRFTPVQPAQEHLPQHWGSTVEDHDTLIRRFGTVRDVLRDISQGRERANFPSTIDLATTLRPGSKVLSGLFSPLPDAAAIGRLCGSTQRTSMPLR